FSRLKRYPKGDPNANSPAGDSDFAVGWCPSHVAIQLRMGLLPQRRTRSGAANHPHSGPDWPPLKRAAVSQIATGGGLHLRWICLRATSASAVRPRASLVLCRFGPDKNFTFY